MIELDFSRVFEASPANFLLLRSDSPVFTILAVSDAYLKATNTVRKKIIGQGLFEVFPDNPDDPHANGVKNLTASLNRAITNKKTDVMDLQKYDIPIPHSKEFEARYWSPENTPVVDKDGSVFCIIHHVTDVTQTQKNSADLAEKIHMLEVLNQSMMGRALKMLELKEDIKLLRKKLHSNSAGLAKR